MEATRATTTAVIDGAVFGSTTETPPEDPPVTNFPKLAKVGFGTGQQIYLP